MVLTGYYCLLLDITGYYWFPNARFIPGWGKMFVEEVTDTCGQVATRETVLYCTVLYYCSVQYTLLQYSTVQ